MKIMAKEIVTKEVSLTPLETGSKDLAGVMQEEAKKRGLITQYISQHMKSGSDYGTIKIGGRDSKPSLFKPGSEKFLSLFKLTARFEKDSETWEMAGSEKGVFAYKCLLYAQNGSVVGEGRGISKLSEKAGWTINNAVKIAEKRAQIDAVLRTGALSDFFTQDLEDMAQPQRYDRSPVADTAVPTVTYDDHEKVETPNKRDVLKRKIKDLADAMVEVPLEGGKGYQNYIKGQTGLELVEGNYEAIIERLKALQA